MIRAALDDRCGVAQHAPNTLTHTRTRIHSMWQPFKKFYILGDGLMVPRLVSSETKSITVVMSRFSGCTDYCLQQFAKPLLKFCVHTNKCILYSNMCNKSLIWVPDLIYGTHGSWQCVFPWISDPSDQSNVSFVIKKTRTCHVLQAVVNGEYWYGLKPCSIIFNLNLHKQEIWCKASCHKSSQTSYEPKALNESYY